MSDWTLRDGSFNHSCSDQETVWQRDTLDLLDLLDTLNPLDLLNLLDLLDLLDHLDLLNMLDLLHLLFLQDHLALLFLLDLLGLLDHLDLLDLLDPLDFLDPRQKRKVPEDGAFQAAAHWSRDGSHSAALVAVRLHGEPRLCSRRGVSEPCSRADGC